jgi:glutaredoxin 3
MHVEIFSKENCGYCTAAKNLLRNSNIPYTEQVLDVHFTRELIVEKYSTARTFPVIVVDNYYIGGYNELRKLLEEKASGGQILLTE